MWWVQSFAWCSVDQGLCLPDLIHTGFHLSSVTCPNKGTDTLVLFIMACSFYWIVKQIMNRKEKDDHVYANKFSAKHVRNLVMYFGWCPSMLPRSWEFISCLSKIQVTCFLESASVFLKKIVWYQNATQRQSTGKISDKERHPIPIFLFSSAKDRLGIEIWATLYISLVHNKEDREAFHRVLSNFCSKQMYLWSEKLHTNWTSKQQDRFQLAERHFVIYPKQRIRFGAHDLNMTGNGIKWSPSGAAKGQ